MKYIAVLVLFFFYGDSLMAQPEYTSSVPSAVRHFEAAIRLYEGRMNEKALEQVEEAVKADPKFIEAHMLKANLLTDMHQSEKAIVSYKDAIAINPDYFPTNFYSLGVEEFNTEKYADAKEHFEKFLTYPKARGILAAKAKKMITNCDFSIDAVKNPVVFEPKNMGDSINSPDLEYFPTITSDGKTFIFTRMLPATVHGRPSHQEDFYISHMTAKGWEKAKPIEELNTPGNEGASALSADGQYLFMIACNDMMELEGARKTKGSCDIFISKKKGDQYMPPRNLEEPINTSMKESMPSFSSDGRTLYFTRRFVLPDKTMQSDIMVSRIGDNSEWSAPESVSDMINTEGDEISVFIHPDDQTLYFCSDGLPGLGGFDIYMSRRDSSGKWQKPVNLGYPINSSQDEMSFLVSPDGKTAYFSSERKGGFGGEDIYQFSLYEKVQPKPVSYMKGKVFDADTKKPLAAHFDLIDLATGKTVVSSSSDEINGGFLVSLPTGKSYALNVSKDGYLFFSENFELKGSKSAEPFIKDVPMMPIKAGEKMVLKNIFYETDKFDLKKESMIELDRLVTFLKKNPKINFEISGHTDNVGTKPYNQTLSERRAKSVYNYLLSKEIAAARMTSKGYGDSKPVAENTTEKGRAQNRRTEFMVTSTN
jgi:outer membrane protein OmpA-like peptidoglycan-associated protein/Tol biopolymer transport system component